MSWEYVRRRPGLSWHIVLTPTRMFDTYRTLCGRTIQSKDISGELPGNEKTCERCAVHSVRRADHADDPQDTSPVPEDG